MLATISTVHTNLRLQIRSFYVRSTFDLATILRTRVTEERYARDAMAHLQSMQHAIETFVPSDETVMPSAVLGIIVGYNGVVYPSVQLSTAAFGDPVDQAINDPLSVLNVWSAQDISAYYDHLDRSIQNKTKTSLI